MSSAQRGHVIRRSHPSVFVRKPLQLHLHRSVTSGMTEMRFDSVGLGYTARAGHIFVHYPTTGPDGTPIYESGFAIGLIPEHYRTAPPSGITAERVALWDELLAAEGS